MPRAGLSNVHIVHVHVLVFEEVVTKDVVVFQADVISLPH